MNTNDIVILGGGYAGALAAARIARRGIPVTLVDARDALVERIRLHQVAAGDDVPPVPYRRLFRNLPVSFVRARVTAIGRERRLVHTDAGSLRYDRLVYALGSDAPGFQPLAIREKLRTARSAAVIGGGLTGIETAAEIAERHPHVAVTLVDAGTIGSGLSERARRHLHDWFAAHNVTLIENHRVATDVIPSEVEGSEARVARHAQASSTGRPDPSTPLGMTPADVVIRCTSFALPPIAAEAGLRVNERGQIVVDHHLRSSDPFIFAAGDAAFVPGLRMSCAAAMPMGAYVADFLTGATREPFRFGYAIQCISLGRHDGIIQFVNADDSPRDVALFGRTAAWIKELVCRFTVTTLKLETRGFHYRWPKPEPAAA